MECRASTASWSTLAHLRKRGQKPAGAVWVSDDWRQRQNLSVAGNLVLPLPSEGDAVYVAGLEVILIASPGEKASAAAQLLASAGPRRFVTYFRGRGAEVVL